MLAEIEAEHVNQPKIVVSSADADTPEAGEARRRFLQGVKDRSKRIAEETKHRTDELLATDGREGLFGKLLERLWMEATWLKSTSQFANGKPLNQQYRRNIIIIGTLLDGLAAWEKKQLEGPKQPPQDFNYQQAGGDTNGLG